nr:reverse transcriptase domain-containing protein [Tanacetum cinerariifolium]
VVASKPKTMQEAVAIATELMDQKIRTFPEREMASKRKFENTSRSTQNQQQQPNKRQNTGQVYTVASGERMEYVGTLPLCNKCKVYHNGRCTIKCANCKRVGHLTRDCRSPAATNNHRNTTCYECGNQGHYRSDFPE